MIEINENYERKPLSLEGAPVIRYLWRMPGYENERVPYAFSNGTIKQTVVTGILEDELKAANIGYERCQFGGTADSFFVKDTATLPANGLYDIRVTLRPGSDSLGKLVTTNSVLIIQIKFPNDFGSSHAQVSNRQDGVFSSDRIHERLRTRGKT